MRILEWEHRLMEALLAGQDPVLDALRHQYTTAQVRSREYTGVGCYTSFIIADTAPRVEPSSFEIDDVHLDFAGSDSGAMAILFVRGGMIDFLEVCAYSGDFPADPQIRLIDYSTREPGSTDSRDMDLVRSFWER